MAKKKKEVKPKTLNELNQEHRKAQAERAKNKGK